MTDLSGRMRLVFLRDQELLKKSKGEPYCELSLEMAEIGLRSFAPKQAHDFVTLSLPAEKD